MIQFNTSHSLIGATKCKREDTLPVSTQLSKLQRRDSATILVHKSWFCFFNIVLNFQNNLVEVAYLSEGVSVHAMHMHDQTLFSTNNSVIFFFLMICFIMALFYKSNSLLNSHIAIMCRLQLFRKIHHALSNLFVSDQILLQRSVKNLPQIYTIYPK